MRARFDNVALFLRWHVTDFSLVYVVQICQWHNWLVVVWFRWHRPRTTTSKPHLSHQKAVILWGTWTKCFVWARTGPHHFGYVGQRCTMSAADSDPGKLLKSHRIEIYICFKNWILIGRMRPQVQVAGISLLHMGPISDLELSWDALSTLKFQFICL